MSAAGSPDREAAHAVVAFPYCNHLGVGAGLARLHYFVALVGVAVEAIGIAGTEWGNPFFDPFRIVGAVVVAIGFVIFAFIVLGTRRARAA